MRFERLENTLSDLRSRIHDKWKKLTKDDLDKIEGHYSGLGDVIAKRYSMTKAEASKEVEDFANEVDTTFREVAEHLSDAAAGAWRNGRHAVRNAFDATTDKANELWEASKDSAYRLREGTNEVVRSRPLTSVLVAAGVGILAGMLLRRSR